MGRGGLGVRVISGRVRSKRRTGRRTRRLWRVKKFPFYVPQTRWGLLRLTSIYRLSLRQVSGGVPMTLFRYRLSATIFRELYSFYPLVILGRVAGTDQFTLAYRSLLEATLQIGQTLITPVRRSTGIRFFPKITWLAPFLGGGSFMLCGGGFRWLMILHKIIKCYNYLSLLVVRLDGRTASYSYFFRKIVLGRHFWWFIKNFIDNLKFIACYFIFRTFSMLRVWLT